MAEETKATDTSDAALDAALETPEVVEEPAIEEPVAETEKPEEVKEPEVKEEPKETDQQFRSKLGRRLSKMEEETGKKIEQLGSIIQRMESALNNQSVRQVEPIADEYPTTTQVEQIALRAFQKAEQQKQQAAYEYNENYLNTVARLGTEEGLNDAEFTRLEELINTSFNKKKYRDPAEDAEINYNKAMRVIERERSQKTEKKINLKGDTPKATGVATTTQVTEKSEPEVKLDEHAAAFVKWSGMDAKKVHGALRGETPLSLRKQA